MRAQRPLPFPVATASQLLPCYACAGRYTLGQGPKGEPVLLHSLPYCKVFKAVETVADACAYSQKCQAAIAAS